ncbi:MAG: transglycosylase domain-containing protein [Patescibacteria group bacterium]
MFSKLKPKTKKHKKSVPKKRILWKRIPKGVKLFTVGMTVAVMLALVFFLYSIFKDLPSPKNLNSPNSFAVSSEIYDRNGTLLYQIFADENRTPIKLKDLPPYVYQASISIEDKSFYKHFGFDFLGMIRAVRNTFFNQSLQGGSTITQQLVKNVLLTKDRTLKRKIKEAILTVATEALYSKDQILEMYLNDIPYGGTSYGVEAASKAYFNKSAKDLTIGEAALLAGLPQAPSRYSPFQSDPKNSRNRQAEVLRRMREDGYITTEQETHANTEELHFALSRTNIKAPHFVFYVKDQLIQKYGEDVVEKGGLRVRTSLDLGLQEVAQASLSAEVDKLARAKVSNGAAMITKPDTGEILSMIGSKDYFDATSDGQVNVTIEQRQPGSSIKPIDLAVSFEDRKQTPATMILDIPTCFVNAGQALYCPQNYDHSFHGPVQQRFAIGNSYNIPAVKTLYINGVAHFIDMAKRFGITTWGDASNYGISLGLGAGEVRMSEMAEAYGTIANQGVHVPLLSILEVKDYQGKVLEDNSVAKRKVDLQQMTDDESIEELDDLTRAIHRAPSYLISHIMLDNNARTGAFGSNSKLIIKDQVVSVKTGTTNNIKDNWTVGFTPEFLTITWVGNNDNTSMNQNLVSGVTGAAPIWNDIMTYVLKDQKPLPPVQPGDVVAAQVCTMSGLLPNLESPCSTRTEYFWEGTEPTAIENISKEIWIDPTTGLPPTFGQSWEGLDLQLQRHTVLSDPFTTDYCLDCTRTVDDKGKVQYERYSIPGNFDPSAFNPNDPNEQVGQPGQPTPTPAP